MDEVYLKSGPDLRWRFDVRAWFILCFQVGANNLLRSLNSSFVGKIHVMYLDVPFNFCTFEDSDIY